MLLLLCDVMSCYICMFFLCAGLVWSSCWRWLLTWRITTWRRFLTTIPQPSTDSRRYNDTLQVRTQYQYLIQYCNVSIHFGNMQYRQVQFRTKDKKKHCFSHTWRSHWKKMMAVDCIYCVLCCSIVSRQRAQRFSLRSGVGRTARQVVVGWFGLGRPRFRLVTSFPHRISFT